MLQVVVGGLLGENGQLVSCKELLTVISRFTVKVDPAGGGVAADSSHGGGGGGGLDPTETAIVVPSVNSEYQHVLTRALISLGRLLQVWPLTQFFFCFLFW